MQRRFCLVLSGCFFLLAAVHAFAHHGSSSYDHAKKITLKGVVTKINWINPHAFVYLDVTGDNGRVENWAIEGLSPNALKRLGWNEETLKPGIEIVVAGHPPRNTDRLTSQLSYDADAVARLKTARVVQAGEITLASGAKKVFGMGTY